MTYYQRRYTDLHSLVPTTHRNLTLVINEGAASSGTATLVAPKKFIQVKPNKVVRADLLVHNGNPPEKIEQPALIRATPNAIIRPEMLKKATVSLSTTTIDVSSNTSLNQKAPSRASLVTSVKKRIIRIPRDRQSSTNKRLSKTRFINRYCTWYNKYGRCKDGQKCPFKHDDTRIGICKKWLKGEKCPTNSPCHLQHEPSPHIVPHCRHFQRGWCTNDNCRYTHVHVRKDAPLCKDFLHEGYCPKGNTCKEKHEWRSRAELECELQHQKQMDVTNKHGHEDDNDDVDMTELCSDTKRMKMTTRDAEGNSDIWNQEYISLRHI